jgi:transcription elongation factor Elf1
MGQAKKKRFWEQTIPVEQTVQTRTYRCPVCGELLFSVPYDLSVPPEKTEMVCKNGHKVIVPNFERSQMV